MRNRPNPAGLILAPLWLLAIAAAPPATPAPTTAPASDGTPTTAPASRPSLSTAQLDYLHAAKAFTAMRKQLLPAEIKAARDEYNAAKGGQVIPKLMDDAKVPVDEKRFISPAGKIVHQFKTAPKRKEVADALKLQLDRLESEKATIDAGKFRTPTMSFNNEVKLNDAGDVLDSGAILEASSSTDYIVQCHGATFRVIGGDAVDGAEAKKVVPLPNRLAATGTQEYLNRFGNAQTIIVLTYVEPFKLEEHADE